MAMTATITSITPSTIKAGPGPATNLAAVVTLTISNSAAGGPAIPVLGIRPIAYNHGSQQVTGQVVFDTPIFPNGAANTVAPGGSLVVTFGLDAYSPQVGATAGGAVGPSQRQYDITAEITCGDGTITYPAVGVLTVNEASHS